MKTLLDAVIAAGTGSPIQLESPKNSHGLEISTSGTFTALTVNLEGSISGIFWSTLATGVFTSEDFTANGKLIASDKMVDRVRAKVATYTSGQASHGTLTITGTLASGNAVTIGDKVYTFGTTLAAADGSILIDASPATSIINLGLAITLGAGSGTKYTAAEEHPSASIGTVGATTMIVRANTKGIAGDAILTSATGASLSFTHAHLQEGKACGIVTVNYSPYPTR